MESLQSKHTSLVNTFALQIRRSCTELRCKITNAEIEEIAIFLVRTMGSDSRDYHRPEHSLDVSKLDSPIPRLAAFFHDLIYVQVDPSWRVLSQIIHPFIPDDASTLNVVSALKKSEDPWPHAITVMFGVDQESNLTPSLGLNEFLSALVMYKKMSPHLDSEVLFRAIACIVATVPFLGIDSEGKNPAQRLVIRMKSAAKILGLRDFPETFYDQTVSECCEIVSTDLASFGAIEFSDYISNTWKVMYESYPPLRNLYFLISEYRKAVFGNISFLETLDSSRLYWNAYSPQKWIDSQLDSRSNYNLRTGQIYLKAVGVSLSVLEAIALSTGGDAPYELFVGPVKRSREHNPLAVEEFLAIPESIVATETETIIFNILKEGRNFRARFDSKRFPLGAYLFAELKTSGIFELYEMAKKLNTGGISPQAFLDALPTPILNHILKALSHTVLTRKGEFEKLIHGRSR